MNIDIKTSLLLIVMFLSYYKSFEQEATNEKYANAYNTLQELLQSPQPGSLKNAVITTEKAFLNNFSDTEFKNQILLLSLLAKDYSNANSTVNYHRSDSANLKLNFAIYKVLKNGIVLKLPDSTSRKTIPYTYDFNDFFGEKDWSNMFVTKLLATHSGNCHSLPYLYKILADELGATCWLSLAPNHMYIKNRCKEIGWYNTELSSGDFPIDAWIMASGYLPLQAIQNGIYMDTLSNQQEIALCVLDLAKGYEHQTRNYYDGFIIRCCDLSLQYFPLNVQAMLLKAETLKRLYEKQHAAKDTASQSTYNEMEQLYVKLFDLGYREMPEKMYRQWLQSVMKEKAKYANPKVSSVVGSKTK